MDVQGVSTRRNKTITGELCGHGFSASAISGMNVKLDGELERFARRTLEERCCVHFLRNALGHLPRKAGDDCRSGDLQSALRENGRRCRATQCLTELRWLHDRRDAAEARVHLAAWIDRWSAKHPKLTPWVEEQIEEPERSGDSRRQTFTFYRLPHTHHKHLKSTNLLERFHQEPKRRSLVVRILPNDASCLRLIRALAAEQHEEWLDGARYLDMQPLADLHPSRLQLAA